MNPFDLLPKRIPVRNPQIRIGAAVAQRMVNAREALELLRTGNYRQEFTTSGQFLGLVFGLQCADKAVVRMYYIPEEMPAIEIRGVKFIQPITSLIPPNERTVTPYAFV